MAIFRVQRRNSPSETLLKVLYVLTEDITLIHGEILMSQFKVIKEDCSIKMSLYIEPNPEAYVGVRNIWLQDSGDDVVVTFATRQEGNEFMMKLRSAPYWSDIVPEKNKKRYNISNLDKAAEDVRNYILLGVRPDEPMTPTAEQMANDLLKACDFDILATFESLDDI